MTRRRIARRATVAASRPDPLQRIRAPDRGSAVQPPANPPTRRGPAPRGGGEVVRISVRLSAEEHARALAVAEQRGVTVSDVTRTGLLREIGE